MQFLVWILIVSNEFLDAHPFVNIGIWLGLSVGYFLVCLSYRIYADTRDFVK